MTLLSRVEALTGPDRDIDAELARMVGEPQAFFAAHGIDMKDVDAGEAFFIDPGHFAGGGQECRARTYTASVDAALAFAEKVLPGIPMYQMNYSEGKTGPFLVSIETPSDDLFTAVAATMPLAIILAVLRAKEGI